MIHIIRLSSTTGAKPIRSELKIAILQITVNEDFNALIYSLLSITLLALWNSFVGSLHGYNSIVNGILSGVSNSLLINSSSF